MTVKRIMILLIAFALLALSAAAEGNRLMEIEGDEYLRSMFASGDRLVLVGDDRLYTWREGEDGFTGWEPDFRLDAPPDNAVGIYETALFDDGGALRGLRVVHDENYEAKALQLFDVAFTEDGRVGGENPVELALPGGLTGLEWFQVESILAHDGLLYMLIDANDSMLCVMDPDSPRSARAETLREWGNRLLATPEGVLLVSERYDEEGRKAALSRVREDAALEERCVLPASANSIAADPETGDIYAAAEGRVCPVDISTGTLGEAVAALSMYAERAALLSGGRRYAAFMQNGGVAVLDTGGALDENAILTVRCGSSDEWVRKAVMRFAVEHPEATPVLIYDYQDVLQEMMSQSGATDVYILDVNYNGSYQAMLNRGFMLPLDGSEAISAVYERIYPGIQPFIGSGDVPMALPVSVYGSCMGFDTALLKKLGLSAGDLPDSWPDFLDFLEQTVLPNLDKLGDNDRFTYDGMTAGAFRFFLFQSVLQSWDQTNRAAGQVADYEDPRLVSVLERLDGMDFTEFGLEEDNEDDGYGYGWGSETHYLVQISRGFALQDSYDLSGVPVALGFGDDLPGVYALNMSAAFVNPYGSQRESAVAFVEALAQAMPDTLQYALFPDLNEPIRRENWEQTMAEMAQNIAEWEARLAEAEPAERQQTEEILDCLKRDYESFEEKGSWLISEEALDNYRAIGDRLTVSLPSWFDKDTSGEAWELLEQYRARQLTAREFLAAVNKKARMMAMEEGE